MKEDIEIQSRLRQAFPLPLEFSYRYRIVPTQIYIWCKYEDMTSVLFTCHYIDMYKRLSRSIHRFHLNYYFILTAAQRQPHTIMHTISSPSHPKFHLSLVYTRNNIPLNFLHTYTPRTSCFLFLPLLKYTDAP